MRMITEDVKGKRYKQFIDLLSRECDRFAFVENREMMEIEEERLFYIDQLIDDIKDALIERKIQREWETTKLFWGTAYVYYFRLTNKTKQFLKRYSHSLFGLTRPDRPEDLMIYRGKECFLAVCSHESYFLVNERLWSHFTHKNKK